MRQRSFAERPGRKCTALAAQITPTEHASTRTHSPGSLKSSDASKPSSESADRSHQIAGDGKPEKCGEQGDSLPRGRRFRSIRLVFSLMPLSVPLGIPSAFDYAST